MDHPPPPRPLGAAASRAVLEALPAHIAVIDSGGVIVDVNEAWRRFAHDNGGAPEAAGPGASYLEACRSAAADGGDANPVYEGILGVLAGTCARFSHEYACHGPGELRWFSMEVAPLAADGARGAVVMHFDVTQRTLYEQALREQSALLAEGETRYRRTSEQLAKILDSSPDVICSMDAGGRFTQVSAGAERVLGYRAADLLGTCYIDHVVPEDRTETLRQMAEVVAGRPTHSFQNRFLCRDGSVAHVVWSARWSPEERSLFCVARDNTEAILFAEAHKMLSERLHSTLEHMGDGFITLDSCWRITYVNRATETVLGASREEMVGRSFWDVFPESRGSRFETEYRRAIAEGRSVQFQEFYEPLGMWVEVRAFPSPGGLAIYFRDVTANHRAQQALQESEERFKHVAEATTDATWDWDLRRDTAWWSEGMERLFGLPRGDDNVGRWVDNIHPDDRDRVVRSMGTLLEGAGRLWEQSYRFGRRDGSYAYVLDRGFVVRDAAGRALRMVGGIKDLTAQKMAEDQLREQAQLLDAARDAIQVRDLDHRILYWNRSCERVYGWPAAQALGRNVETLLYREDAPFREASAQVLARGEWLGEHEVYSRAGRRIVVEGRWTLLRDADGAPRRILAIDTDVTERTALERQLIRSQRLESIGTLAGGIAHDLNNVLTPILMSASLLRHPGQGAEEAQLLDAISTSAQRGTDMVGQLLAFARGAEGRRVRVDPARVVEDVRRIAAETFPRDIGIVTFVSHDLDAIVGDETQLHQVLLNLCLNARDAMPRGGTLTLCARNDPIPPGDPRLGRDAVPGRYVAIDVEDTGTGMPPEVMDRIFDPFFTTKDPGKGTGLGLPTSLAIVQRHGGVMNVESEPGRGTMFRIHLPAEAAAADAPEREAPPARPRGAGQTVLVVDDEAPIRQVAEQTLRAHGYRVLVARDGAEALEVHGRNPGVVDVALVDMMMPVMDGAAAIQVLRARDARLPIVAASGIADGTHLARATAAGVDEFLPKPYTVESLLQALARVLGPSS